MGSMLTIPSRLEGKNKDSDPAFAWRKEILTFA
jgi:hypothetical protein